MVPLMTLLYYLIPTCIKGYIRIAFKLYWKHLFQQYKLNFMRNRRDIVTFENNLLQFSGCYKLKIHLVHN